MHTSLSDAFHFLVGVVWCFDLVSVTIHGDTGPQLLQGCICSSLVLLWNSVISEVYLLWQGLAVGRVILEVNLLRQGVCPSVSVSVQVLSDFFRCFPKSSSSVSPPVPSSIFSMCLPAPLASSCHSSLSIFKQKHYVHLWLRFWLAVDCLHPFFLLTSAGQPANSSHVSPLQSLPLVASAVEHSKPRYTDAASVKLLSLLMEWSCSRYEKLFLICGEEGSNPYLYICIYII